MTPLQTPPPVAASEPPSAPCLSFGPFRGSPHVIEVDVLAYMVPNEPLATSGGALVALRRGVRSQLSAAVALLSADPGRPPRPVHFAPPGFAHLLTPLYPLPMARTHDNTVPPPRSAPASPRRQHQARWRRRQSGCVSAGTLKRAPLCPPPTPARLPAGRARPRPRRRRCTLCDTLSAAQDVGSRKPSAPAAVECRGPGRPRGRSRRQGWVLRTSMGSSEFAPIRGRFRGPTCRQKPHSFAQQFFRPF